MTTANSKNYTAGRTADILYLVMHYTANDGDTAQNNVTYFANNVTYTSAHWFVDENGTAQSVDDGDTAYHCGATTYKHASCRNANSIGIEMCSRKTTAGAYYLLDDTVSNAVALAKAIMAEHNIPIENVIRHYDVTGKSCPAPWVNDESQWTAFKAKLVESEEEEMTQEQFNEKMNVWIASQAELETPDWAIGEYEEAKGMGITDGTFPLKYATRLETAIMVKRGVAL